MDVKPVSPADVSNRKDQAVNNVVFSIVNRTLCNNDQRIIYEVALCVELLQYPFSQLSIKQIHRCMDAYRAVGWTVTYHDGASDLNSASWLFEPSDAA